MEVRLSKRLTALASLVTAGHRLADIGTDHGYIPIYLVQQGAIPSAIAMDVNKGPLERARAHVNACGLSDKIELRLSDGVRELKQNEADTVLIAGMGGGLIQKILTEGQKVLLTVPELILQPQSEIVRVRAFLRREGYHIVDEDMVVEDGKYYPMMKVHKIEKNVCSPSDVSMQHLQDLFGPILLEQGHLVLCAWIRRELQTVETVLQQLGKSKKTESIAVREREMLQKQRMLLTAEKICRENSEKA